MRIRVFQHAPFEGPGSIADWANERGHTIETTHLYAGEVPPPPDSFDWLVVMGGPMSVHDEAVHPWLRTEKAILREAIDAGKTVVGICLGAQLIARVLGAAVRKNTWQEIGWHPIAFTPAASRSPLRDICTRPLEVLHWHGETFDLPAGAVRLAGSEACANQIFLMGDRVLGLQCHLECTPEGVANLLENCPPAPDAGPFVQDASAIREGIARCAENSAALHRILDRLAELPHRP
jgi:GMP synthase - Glutamine amidotransferase domain